MSAPYHLALQAAHAAASAQDYPRGALYVVATPIGNLADISLRALHVLTLMDALACEDTRHTQGLLRSYGIDRPLIAVHQHNEQTAAQALVQRLAQGQRIAYISDAGTPAISDPGARLVAQVQAAGLRVVPLPGPSSVTTALCAAGLAGEGGFVFVGFLPSRAAQRAQALRELAQQPRAAVLLEAPHRISALARSLGLLGPRRVTIGRELTKQFEQIVTLPAQEISAWLGADPQRERGEFVLVLHPTTTDSHATDNTRPAAGEPERVLALLLPELPLKTAVQLAAQITGAQRNALYDMALAQRSAQDT